MGETMEILKGDFTQADYNELTAELTDLKMRIYLDEDTKKNRDKVKEIKNILKKELEYNNGVR